MKWSLRRRIGHFLKRTRMAPTRFGMEAVRDPKFVFSMNRGRVVRLPTEARILAYLDRAEQELEAPSPRRRR